MYFKKNKYNALSTHINKYFAGLKDKFCIDLSKKNILIVLSFFCLFILFHNSIEQLVSSLFVEPILSNVDSNVPNDIIIFGAFLLVGYYSFKRISINYYSSFTEILVIILFGLIYFYYRLAVEPWYFPGFSIFPKVKYFDILLFAMLGILVNYFINFFRIEKKDDSKDSGFIVDEPIFSPEQDSLSRKALAQNLARKLRNTRSNSSIAIGITGMWGCGKTSFLHLINHYLTGNEIVKVEFNPWKSLDSKTIIKDFFEVLSSSLEEHSSSLSNKISKYGNHLLSINDNVFIKAVSVGSQLLESKDINEQFDDINKVLGRTNKQIVVTIDDLDRLDKHEIVEVLRLIRNTANFNNIKFLVAFDRDYVLNAIKEDLNSHNYDQFLEKIFLQIKELPPMEITELNDLLLNSLINQFPSQENKIRKTVIGDSFTQTDLTKVVVRSLRDVKRLVNFISSDYELVTGEVEFDDFIKIELLKFKFPIVHQLLYFSTDNYLDKEKVSNIIIEGSKYVLRKTNDTTGNAVSVIEKDLRKYYQDFNMQEKDIPVVLILLNSLFAREIIADWPKNDHLSIKYPTNFHKYFINRLLDTDLSENEFLQLLDKPLEQLTSGIKTLVNQGKKVSLLFRFKEIDSSDLASKEKFEKLICAIFFLGKTKKENSKYYEPSHLDEDLYDKLLDRRGRISEKFYNGSKEDYKSFVTKIFYSAESPYLFESSFVEWLIKNSFGGFSLEQEELENMQIRYFKGYLNEVDKFDDNVWRLYYNCVVRDKEFPNTTTLNIKAHKLLKQFAKSKDLDGFLFSIIYPESPELIFFKISELVTSIFHDYDEFENFLKRIDKASKEESVYLPEFKKFYRAFKTNSYKQPFKFHFETIPVKEKYTSII